MRVAGVEIDVDDGIDDHVLPEVRRLRVRGDVGGEVAVAVFAVHATTTDDFDDVEHRIRRERVDPALLVTGVHRVRVLVHRPDDRPLLEEDADLAVDVDVGHAC